MPKYRVYLRNTISFSVSVDAEDQDAAIERAYDEAPYEVCPGCAGWGKDWSMEISGEWSEADLAGIAAVHEEVTA